jgi:hypothetical protein
MLRATSRALWTKRPPMWNVGRQGHFASSRRLHRSRMLNLGDARARPGTGPSPPWLLVGCYVGSKIAVDSRCSAATCQSFGSCRRGQVAISSKLTGFCCSAPKELSGADGSWSWLFRRGRRLVVDYRAICTEARFTDLVERIRLHHSYGVDVSLEAMDSERIWVRAVIEMKLQYGSGETTR